MRLSKGQSLLVAVASIALFFVVGISLMKREANQGPLREDPASSSAAASIPAAPAADAPASSFVLGVFQRSEVKNGKKQWEVKAKDGFYNPEKSTATVHDAVLWVYDKSGDVIELTAKEAILHLQGPALTKAEASGGVRVVRNGEVTVETEKAVYDKVNNKMTAPGVVRLTSDKADISGTRLEVDLNSKELTLQADVSTLIKPKVGEKPDL